MPLMTHTHTQNQENDMLKQILQKYIDQPVNMVVYNSKSRTTKDITLVPSNTWGGQGLLGVSIRFCTFDGATENVWHVLVSDGHYLECMVCIN